MAATLQHCNTATTTPSPLKSSASTSPNPQLKRLVYSKYRELLGSYNDQANAYIDTLPSYMVHKDNGFNLEPPTIKHQQHQANDTTATAGSTISTIHLTSPPSPGGNEMYGSGQRMPAQSTYEAPACVQNAMTRDKKPFTYTPGGIDLSQIKSERMAKRLARNACAEGASGQSQHNRPQPASPASPGGAAAAIGAAAMGMPFQVLPLTPHPHTGAGKNTNGGCAPAPPPPPPSSSNFLNTNSLAPQMNGGVNGGRGSAPNSPNMQRKIPPPPPSQRFEPPPLGFRPEIKIPPNPMAGLRKVPPPVEKNTFWKDEYKKERSGSDDTPRVATAAVANVAPTPVSSGQYTDENDSVNSSSSTRPQTNASNGTDQITTNGETNIKTNNSDITDGFKKTMPTTTTNKLQQNQTNNNVTNTQEQEAIKTPPPPATSPPTAIKPSQEQEQAEKPHQQQQHKSPTTASPDTQSLASITRPTPPTSPQQQSTIKPTSPSLAQQNRQQQFERESATPPAVASPPKTATPPHHTPQHHIQQQQTEALQKQQSPKPEFRSVAAAPPPAAVNVFTRQTESPRSVDNATPPRVTESPFRQTQQQRTPVAISPLVQQQATPSSAMSGNSISPNPPAQTVPWRTQRGQTPQKQAAPAAQSQTQPLYNNVQQPSQRAPDFSTQTAAYQGPKPTNVGSLYIAPLAAPTEPQAQHIVRQQQLQQQQPTRDSPMRQMTPSQQQTPNQQLRWMSSQPKQPSEQPPWAVRPEENGNVVPSSLNRLKSPPPQAQASFQSQQQQQQQPYQQPMYQTQPQPQPYNQGNGFMTSNIPVSQNFGAQHNAPVGLRLQINTKSIQNPNTNNQSGPRERIIPIQLEQTPTYTPTPPTFNTPSAYAAGSTSPAPGYVMRTPNQFVDQGYNNYGTPLNAPRMVQQQQQQSTAGGNARTHIVPIAMENSEGTRGPISKTPIVIQNDLRTPPIQSKSFRILQKITDTIDGANNDESGNQQRNDNYMDAEPQLQRPTFARQMSAQQARNSPTVEQMRRMKIGHEQGNSTPQTPSQFNQQPRPFYNSNNNDYIPPSEQHVPEPKKYTGSAIPSRSFKILQAMTQPENAGEQEQISLEYNDETGDETKSEYNHDSCTTSSSSVEPTSSTTSMSSLNSTDSICSAPTPPPTQTVTQASYPYPYGYPWYPPPPPCPIPSPTANGEGTNWPYGYAMPPPPPVVPGANGEAPNWPYAYAMPPPPPVNGEAPSHPPYPPYPYYYPYYPLPPYAPHAPTPELDAQSIYAPYLPPPPPYHAYPYPVAPSYSQSSNSSRASSVLPDIIITPSTDDVPSKVILQHNIKIKKEKTPKREGSVDIEDVTSEKSNHIPDGSIVDILTKHLENMSNSMENNLNSSRSNKKSYKKNFEEEKSPEDNTSPVQITMVNDTEPDSDTESCDSDATTKQFDTRAGREGSGVPLQSIRSVTNVQVYNGLKHQQQMGESDDDDDSDSDNDNDDDDTTADGESDVFDEECEEDFEYDSHHPIVAEDSDCEEFIVEDNLSVIYEEESDLEKSSDLGKAMLKRSSPINDLEKCIEENDDDEQQEEEDNGDSNNSVTVRLPLKFSFTKSSNAQPVTTVEVGKSQVEDRRHSLTLSEKQNAFSVATLDNDSDNDDSDSCEVSVTISLSRSSRSGSTDSRETGEVKNVMDKYPIEDMPLPENALKKLDSSEEDVSFSFSLNKRNKFVGQTLKGDLTNNIALLENEEEKLKKEEMVTLQQSTEELDFFATLRATKMQAQKIKEQSANYWGKSIEREIPNKEQNEVKEEKIEQIIREIPESPTKQEEVEETVKEAPESPTKTKDLDELKSHTSFWDKYSANNREISPEKISEKSEAKEEKVEESVKEIPESPIKAKDLDEFKAGSSFWAKYSTTNSEKSPEEMSEKNEVKEEKVEETVKEIPESSTKSQDLDELKKRTSFWAKYSSNNREKSPEKISEKIEAKVSQEDFTTTQSCWDNYSTSNKDSETSTDTTTSNEPAEIEDIWANQEEEDLVVPKKSINNYWANNTIEPEEVKETKANEEIEDIWATRSEEDTPSRKSSQNTAIPFEPSEEEEEETVIDIWAERDTDMPAVKNLSKKLDSLETAKNSFWSTVAEANSHMAEDSSKEDGDFWSELKAPKRKPKPESITEISYSPTILRHRIDELSRSLKATIHLEEESQENEKEEINGYENKSNDEEEVDFWAQLEEERQESCTPPKETFTANHKQQDTSLWNADEVEEDDSDESDDSSDMSISPQPTPAAYDPLKYPEEPREVDTDEEIDFWAEIEAKGLQDDDDVTFHRAASFWASRDRKNSVDETPYKPVSKKPFPAKLPDEPPMQDLNIWAALEAHKGDEPVIIDPAVEEEKELAQEFDHMSSGPAEMYEDPNNSMLDVASVHEPVVASVWPITAENGEVYEDPNNSMLDVASVHEPVVASVWPITAQEVYDDPNISTLAAASVHEPLPASVWPITAQEVYDEANNTTLAATSVHEPLAASVWPTTAENEQVYEDPNNSMLDVASVHEPVVASVWPTPAESTPVAQTEEPDFWAEIENSTSSSSEKDNEDLEAKRQNYRKAMAFFTTSIDENKEEGSAQPETDSLPHSYLSNDTKEQKPKTEMDKKSKKPPKKETTPKNKSKSPPKVKSNQSTPSEESKPLPEVYVEPTLSLKRLPNGLPDLEVSKFNEERKVSVRDRISVFETGSFESPDSRRNSIINTQSLSVDSSSNRQGSLSRNSSSQRSESEIEEDDSGVTDMNKLSETETESESFPELRKMSSYQRAATHSRLFKLLQDDTEGLEEGKDGNAIEDLRPSRKKVVHNVSITRKQNPKALAEVETMSQRRERLSLPLRKNTSIDADNPSTPNSPASPIMDQSANQSVVSDKLVSELVQSLLLKSDSTHLRKLPMEKLQAAAKRVLEEELDSLENTSVDSTPAMTPNDVKRDKSYAEYYNTWSDANGSGEDIVPSKSFKALQDTRRSPWTARCPRVLSSKTINRDLARVTESPEIFMRQSKSPESFRQSRENSVSRWRKA